MQQDPSTLFAEIFADIEKLNFIWNQRLRETHIVNINRQIKTFVSCGGDVEARYLENSRHTIRSLTKDLMSPDTSNFIDSKKIEMNAYFDSPCHSNRPGK